MNGRRILVVDDEPEIQRFLRLALSAAGYEPIAAGTAAEALKAFVSRAPDAVVLDLGLPDRDGGTCCATSGRLAGRSSSFRRATARPKR